MPELFTAATLAALSGRSVSEQTATAIHTWVVAVISAEIGVLTDEVPPGVAAVALELGKAAVPPPGGASSTTIGPYSASYPDAGSKTEAGLTHQQRTRLRRALGKAAAFSIGTGAADVSAMESP